jgi:phospholipid-binding lipoprotein MlaA
MRRAILAGLLALVGLPLLGGCASQSFSIRSLPPETPAADNAAAAKNAEVMAAMLAKKADVDKAAAAAPPAAAPDDAAAAEPPPLTPADAPSMYTYYRFNARFDESVFLPVSNGYRRVPAPVRAGVHNFFSNLTEVPSFANYILQLRFPGSVRSLGRFVINSTLGIGGLFDVAGKINLKNPPTGFSATLSTWGMHPGPYLVIPLLGPSTLRDGVGYLGDYGVSYGVNLIDLYRGYQSYGTGVVDAVDKRSNVSFRYYATGSPFEYETIRFLYVRKTLIEDEALYRNVRRKDRDGAAPAGR